MKKIFVIILIVTIIEFIWCTDFSMPEEVQAELDRYESMAEDPNDYNWENWSEELNASLIESGVFDVWDN